jgi:glycosyltransferase involved in cell wall biosynthesis
MDLSDMDNKPKISMVLPTYNQAHYLSFALEGLYEQTFKDFELIVVNDGSTDNTFQILESYSQKMDIVVINQENRGLPEALNAGFSVAKGKYYSWTSSDNITLPTMLEVLNQALDSEPSVSVVYADWFFMDEYGDVFFQYKTLDYDRHLLLYHNYVHCCFLFRKECMDKVGGYNPEYIYGEDWEFWIRVSRYFRMKHIPQTLYKYRIQTKSMTTEIIEGTAKQRVNYIEFKARLRNQSKIDWYLSKIKWKFLIMKLGYDPRQSWLQSIHSYQRATNLYSD